MDDKVILIGLKMIMVKSTYEICQTHLLQDADGTSHAHCTHANDGDLAVGGGRVAHQIVNQLFLCAGHLAVYEINTVESQYWGKGHRVLHINPHSL